MSDKSWEPGKFKIQIKNAHVDPWDMLNNFCFVLSFFPAKRNLTIHHDLEIEVFEVTELETV